MIFVFTSQLMVIFLNTINWADLKHIKFTNLNKLICSIKKLIYNHLKEKRLEEVKINLTKD